MKDKVTALYVRVSTENQLAGLESQTRALLSYCEQRQITNYKVYDEFGVSGAKTSRPVLDQLMQDCKDKKIETVLVYSFSRFARSTKHLILALEQFDNLGIGFISHTEAVDTSTAFGRTIFQIIASIAELERELIRDRVRTGLKNAKAKGRQIGAKPKYTNLRAFKELKEKGLSTREIARILNTSQSTVNRALNKTDSLAGSMIESSDKC